MPDPWMILDPLCFDRVMTKYLQREDRVAKARTYIPSQVSFWTSFGVINIFTEAAVISLPAYIIWRLQMSTEQKLAVIACFAMRLLYDTHLLSS
jgi:hypothetical protein